MAAENDKPGKRYYWLKLQDGFFGSKRIKKLRKLAGGDTYTIIYLKMQLLAMKSNGLLEWTGLEDSFADELALDLDEEPDNVAVTLQYLKGCGLCETSDNISFFFPYAVENVGSETSAAKRMREMRARNIVTPALRERYGEKEIEIETEKEIEKEKRARAREDDDNDRFEEFWNAYPRKSGDIRQVYFEYLGVIQSGVDEQEIIDSVKWQAEEKGRYMPNADKWLRNRGWTEKRPEPKVNRNAPCSNAPFAGEDMADLLAGLAEVEGKI